MHERESYATFDFGAAGDMHVRSMQIGDHVIVVDRQGSPAALDATLGADGVWAVGGGDVDG